MHLFFLQLPTPLHPSAHFLPALSHHTPTPTLPQPTPFSALVHSHGDLLGHNLLQEVVFFVKLEPKIMLDEPGTDTGTLTHLSDRLAHD